MMAASAFASAMLRGSDAHGARHASRHAASSLLPVDSLGGTTLISGSALGLWLAGSSLLTMVGPERWHGALLGLGTVVLGVLGLAASGRECLSLRTLMLMGLGFSALSTLELMQLVSRGVETHCMLAEATTRIRHLEERLAQMRQDELITQDDMLGMVQQSATAHTEAHGAVWRAAQADRDYLRAKTAALRRHAVAVGDALRAKIAESKANASTSSAAGNDSELAQSLWSVERRVEAVDSVVRYLDQKEANNELTYEEYEIILEALLEGSNGHVPAATTAVLREEKGGLDTIKAAYERHATQSYDHVVAAGGGGASASIGAVTRVQARKESARKHFENRFMDIFHKHGAHHGAAFSASLNEALQSLPERCVRDVDAYAWLRLLGWLLLAAQFAGGYTALTAFVLVAKKDD
ncbi:hypothetical protein VOLCADRAFT_90497 [Volvox carteri f. nagariensis]|uniref:Uncharacterized protein n=1 Tax=Volvox carteri f. nagariensis TaxID=3068 RepID=D8TUJ4_VOLCA|nr:uncharacterized protein VOLCADRAFT_90497 [Volvox carteri f. nagariensis]EFJ48834.1 hypothetical protein VOLCADRAFT_90497 [Volvox carteri f. nagariensis]|eukprot:XP_002950166.1 hypothetical protein VOLCADRAFT_90497 [Volvox carteri f. nagariensis]